MNSTGWVKMRLAACGLLATAIALTLDAPSVPALTRQGVSPPAALYSWGVSFDGQLGNGTYAGPDTCANGTTCSPSPVEITLPSAATPTAVAGGGNSGYAIGSDGNLYAWGERPLGDGALRSRSTPVQVQLPMGVSPTAIAGGANSGYAIGSDGHLYGWGTDWAGQLATSPSHASLVPEVIVLPGGATAVAIAASNATAYAIASDGRLYAWGYDAQGEIGNGTTVGAVVTPTPVELPTGVAPIAIAAGQDAAYAVGSNGNLYAWGDNYWGELGTGANIGPDSCSGIPCATTPVQVALPVGITPSAIAAGAGAAYAIGSDGNVYGWGDNGAGQIGNGTSGQGPVLAPTRVALPVGVTPTAIAAGGYGDAYAIGSNGALFAWGSNSTGQLGIDATSGPRSCAIDQPPYAFACSPDPVLVPLPGPVAAIAAPFDGGYAIAAPGVVGPATTTTLTSSLSRPVRSGHRVTFRATVTAASGHPTGTVQFSLDGSALGPPVALVDRRAATVVDSLPVGTDTVRADFSSTNGFFPSDATVIQVVTVRR
jgi:alpha-tubulin suppressor-like RCC1 family protein